MKRRFSTPVVEVDDEEAARSLPEGSQDDAAVKVLGYVLDGQWLPLRSPPAPVDRVAGG